MAGDGNQGGQPWSEVALSLYELTGTSGLNLLTRGVGLGSAYHVGVEVYWLEWSFGWVEWGSGVYMTHIGQSTLGYFDRRIPLGRTPLSPNEVIKVIESMRPKYPGSGYHLLRRNCAHFSQDLVKRLKVTEAPEWVNSLAGAGDAIVRSLGADGAEAAADAAMPAAEDRHAPALANFDGATDADYDQLELREMIFGQAKGFILDHARVAEKRHRYHEYTVEYRWGWPQDGTDPALTNPITAALMRDRDFAATIEDAVAKSMGRKALVEGSEAGEKGSIDLVALHGLPARSACARLRVFGKESDTVWPPIVPADFARRFETAMRRSSAQIAATKWPKGSRDLVAGIEVVTRPDEPRFGTRVETPSGPSTAIMYPSSNAYEPTPQIGTTIDRLQRLRLQARARR